MPKIPKVIYYPLFMSASFTPIAWANPSSAEALSANSSDSKYINYGVSEHCQNMQERIAWLEDNIAHHRAIYYTGEKPQITDIDFDFLISELALLSACTSTAIDEYGYSDESLNKVQLSAEMRSLKSVRDHFMVAQFYRQNNKSALLLQPKIDGVAVELVYRNGLLNKAATRGDGKQGKDITQLVFNMGSVPAQLSKTVNMVIHGELYVTESKWLERKKYVSARHMAAGIIHQKSPTKDDIDNLQFLPWRWIDSPFNKEVNSLFVLSELGFENMAAMSHEVNAIADIKKWFEYYGLANSLPVKLDGIVVKVAEQDAQNELGYNRQAPKWALAQKFIGPRGVTKVTNISYQIGNKGRVTPIIQFQPLILAGHSVSKASGHSKPWLEKMHLSIGSEIEIELVGNAIPQLIRVINNDTDN